MGIADLLVTQRVSPLQILKLMLCLMPRVIIFSMPMACLMCVFLAFIRLSSDNEIIALNSSGISIHQMMTPVIFFSLMSYFITGMLAVYGVPWGNRAYKQRLFQIIESKTNFAPKERIFYEPIENIIFYVNTFSTAENIMKDIFVVDRRDKTAISEIVAEKGRILSNQESNIITIHFINGIIFIIEKKQEATRTIKFDTYDLNIDLKDIMHDYLSKEKEPNEMGIGELIESLNGGLDHNLKYNLIGIKLYEMFSIPLAIFLLGIIGAPLGAHVRAKGRTAGIVISLCIFLIYYNFSMGIRYLCENGRLAPAIGVWIPDLFLIAAALLLFARAANYRIFRSKKPAM